MLEVKRNERGLLSIVCFMQKNQEERDEGIGGEEEV